MIVSVLGCSGEDDPVVTAGFEDRAVEAGIGFKMSFLAGEQGQKFKINLYDHGAGVVVADIDGDQDDDLYFLNQLGPNALYRNNGDATFTDITSKAGPIALAGRICTAGAFNDIDNDGDQDLYVTSTRGGNALFTNDGSGRFTDVTAEAGLTWVGHSQGAAFFDADGDGDLDLLVTNTARWTTNVFDPKDRYYRGRPNLFDLIGSPIEHNVFYKNNGDVTFSNATADAGLGGVGWGGDIAVFDIDDDGDLDLFVTNMFGRSLLLENDGKGVFKDVTSSALGRTPWGTVGAKAFDYDSDGRLDLYLVDMHSDMWTPFDYDLSTVENKRRYPDCFGPMGDEFPAWRKKRFVEQTKIRYDRVFFGNGLYRNAGEGKFEDVTLKTGAETFWPWGIGVGDFDNDGHQDAYLASGMGYPWEYWRCPLLKNNGDGTFTDVAGAAGVDPPPGGEVLGKIGGKDSTRSSRSVAVADFDGDGRLDLVVNNFNDRPYLYMNRWPQRNYIAFRLRARTGNRDAVGALVRIHMGSRVLVRQVHAAGGYLSQSSKALHFGLGDTTKVDRCEIAWPGGRRQVLLTPEPNRMHVVTEPSE